MILLCDIYKLLVESNYNFQNNSHTKDNKILPNISTLKTFDNAKSHE